MNTRLLAALAILVSTTGCPEETPEVEINTYVGKSFEQSDPELAQQAVEKVLGAVLEEIEASAPDTPVAPDTITTHPPTTVAELDEFTEALTPVFARALP